MRTANLLPDDSILDTFWYCAVLCRPLFGAYENYNWKQFQNRSSCAPKKVVATIEFCSCCTSSKKANTGENHRSPCTMTEVPIRSCRLPCRYSSSTPHRDVLSVLCCRGQYPLKAFKDSAPSSLSSSNSFTSLSTFPPSTPNSKFSVCFPSPSPPPSSLSASLSPPNAPSGQQSHLTWEPPLTTQF